MIVLLNFLPYVIVSNV